MRKAKLIILFVIILVCGLAVKSCTVRTPEIRGIVLDAETKQPVPEAWMHSTLGIVSSSIAGRSYSYLSVAPPHVRTDKDGRFVIPARWFSLAPFPLSFSDTIQSFRVGASTADDKEGGVKLSNDVRFMLMPQQVTIYLKPEYILEGQQFLDLQGLYNYCETGRFDVEQPTEDSIGCDSWELEYAIKKHERFLSKEIKAPSKRSIIMGQLAYLYKKKGDFNKSMEIFKTVLEYDKKIGVKIDIYQYETQIAELEQLLKKSPTQ